jgi:hypothetical protein
MRFIPFPAIRGPLTPTNAGHPIGARNMALLMAASACLSAAAFAAAPAVISRSIVVRGPPAEVWAMIGSFCAIEQWLPPVGTCTEDGGVPPTRTLVTRDGTATFIERQTARSDSETFYSYVFVSSPLPVTHYSSTIRVKANGDGESTVSWSGSYTPDVGKEAEAATALDGIYTSGLESIQRLSAEWFAPSAPQGVAP